MTVDELGSRVDVLARTRVFISYSRKDLDVADRLVVELEAQNFEAYLDKHDILPGEPWHERLHALIESADNVIFLVSPASVASTMCDWEVNEAERLSKRLFPVVVRDVPDDQVPGRLKRLNYVFLRDGDDRPVGLGKLGDALRTDIEWIREHTRIAELANRWDESQRPPSQLLRGDDIRRAEEWALRRPRSAPGPMAVIVDFIGASRAEADAEQTRERLRHRRDILRSRIITWGSLSATVIVSLLGWFFFQSARQALLSQSQYLADLAQQQTSRGDDVTGMLLALEGLRDPNGTDVVQRFRPYVAEAEFALDSSMRKSRERVVLHGHGTGVVERAEFSPDGRRAATASNDGTAIWDAETGDLLLRIPSQDPIVSVVFSPDGRQILTASSNISAGNGSARLWDAATGEQLATFAIPAILGAVFSPDGKQIITASFDKTAKVVDVSSRMVILTLRHDSWVDSAELSPDGSRLLTASATDPSHLTEGIFRLWDAKTGAVLLTFKAHPGGGAHAAAFSPDGKRIVTAGLDHTARVWDTATGRELLRLEGHSDQVYSAAFSSDGTRIVTASLDRSARIWDATTGSLVTILQGHEYWIMSAVFSPDGRRILTASPDRTARIWDAASINDLPGFSAIGPGAVSSGMRFSSDGARIVGVNAGFSGFDVWDAHSGAAQKGLDCIACEAIEPSFGPDRGHVVALSFDGHVRDLDTDETLFQLDGQFGSDHVIFDPDGRRILVANSTGVRLYDVKSGAKVLQLDHRCLNAAPCAVVAAAFNADGTRIVTGANDKTARVWDAESGRELLRLTTLAEVKSVAFSPDGMQALAASGDRVQLWNPRNGKRSLELVGHDNTVEKAVFSADGSRVLTASLDATARVWDASGKGELYRLEGSAPMTSAVFSPDDTLVLATSLDRKAQLWRIPISTDDLIKQAESRAPRCLSAQQREAFHLSVVAPGWCYELKKWPYDEDKSGAGSWLQQAIVAVRTWGYGRLADARKLFAEVR
jgi:WD40 repeat protein